MKINIRLALSLALAALAVNGFSQNKPVPNTSTQPNLPSQTERSRTQNPGSPSPAKPQPGINERVPVEAQQRVGTKGNQSNLLTPEKLWQLRRVSGEAVSRDGQYAYYGIAEANMRENKMERNVYRVNVKSGGVEQVTKTPGTESNVQFTADGLMLFTYKGQVWTSNADGTNAKQLSTTDGYDNVRLSPDGKKILFTRDVKVRKTVSETYPDLDKANVIIADDLLYRHWNAWEDENASHLFIADFSKTGITNEKDVMANEPYNVPQMPMGGVEDLTWSNDGAYVLYVCKKLSGKEYALSTNSDIYKYDVTTGATTNLSEGMKGYDTKPQVSSDGKIIYWLSMARDGYEADKNDLIAYNVAAKTKTNLTSNWDNTLEDYVLSNDKKRIYILAYHQGTAQVFTIDLPTGKKSTAVGSPKALTSGDFDVASVVGQTENALVVTRTDMNHAPELYTVDISSGAMQQLTHTNDEAYTKIGMCKIEKRWITTSDNQKMLTWVIYPPNFDATKKYPALLYCQGGPQSALSQFYSFRWNFQLMASQGYIVIAPNRRGMPGHGVKWNEDISKDWGGQAIRDYLTATDELAKESFIDRSRIGAVGASYGGYSVYMLAGVHQNRYKTFISHCGLFNLKSWYGTTEEMWFANWDVGGPYWSRNNAELYAKSDPSDFVQNWNRPMLVFHGGKDFRVPENQGMEAYQAAQLMGLKSRLVLFPEEGHWIMQPQNGLLWQREFYKWLTETL